MTVMLNIVCAVILIAVPVIIIASIVQAICLRNPRRKGLLVTNIISRKIEDGKEFKHSYQVTTEVEELLHNHNNNYSKIKILSISGIPRDQHEGAKDIIGTLVETDSVKWDKNDT